VENVSHLTCPLESLERMNGSRGTLEVKISLEGGGCWDERWVRVGTYRKLFKALYKSEFGDGRVDRRDDDIDAGVAKMISLKGPNLDIEECSV